MESVGYDQESQVMEIEFRDGSICRYLEVPWEINRQFMIAADRDEFFEAYIEGKFTSKEMKE